MRHTDQIPNPLVRGKRKATGLADIDEVGNSMQKPWLQGFGKPPENEQVCDLLLYVKVLGIRIDMISSSHTEQ